MKRHLLLPLLLVILIITAARGELVRILFDTDRATDCDDAGALAVPHGLAGQGECEILATVSGSLNPNACAAIDVINRHHHRPDLPSGPTKMFARLRVVAP